MFSRTAIIRMLEKTAIRNRRHLPFTNNLTSSADKSSHQVQLTVDNIFSAGNVRRCKQSISSASKHKYVFKGISAQNPKHAAVLVPFSVVDGVPSVILTLRSPALTMHRAEVSFPGGMMHPSDVDSIETAIRETEEEIGLDRKQISVWGKLLPLPGKNFETLVTPVIGFCGEVNLAALRVNHGEVADIFSVTIESLCNTENIKYTRFRSPTVGSYTMPAFVGGRYRIWGLSALMLHQALCHLAPSLYTNNKVDMGKKW